MEEAPGEDPTQQVACYPAMKALPSAAPPNVPPPNETDAAAMTLLPEIAISSATTLLQNEGSVAIDGIHPCLVWRLDNA